MKEKLINVLISLISVFFTFAVLETGVRIYKSEYEFKNFLREEKTLFRSAYPSEYHSELGWIPRAGTSGKKNKWGTNVTILEDGIRANHNNDTLSISKDSELVLAVGDSFTFGDQVSNDETWPAILERITGKRVINGGVFGYGADQSFLRMKMLVQKYNPDIVIFSFIPEDIRRCELSERTSVPKPYFNVIGDRLILNNKHVSSYSPDFDNKIYLFKRMLGYSSLIHKIMLRAFPDFWLGRGWWRSTRVHLNGKEVTCLIFKEIKGFAVKNGVKRVFILAQYPANTRPPGFKLVDNVVKCIDRESIRLVDIRNSLLALKKHNRSKYESLFQRHMTKEGNYFVAKILKEAIYQLK